MNKPKLQDSLVIIRDAFGIEWHANEARPTKYGFDLIYGRKKEGNSYEAAGRYRLIYTSELKAFWEKYALRSDGTIYDLPAGRTTLKRARLAFGFNWDKDSARFWRKHKSEMASLKPRVFEKKYKEEKITGDRMSFWRLRILGGKARPLGWWKDPEVLKLLLSDRSLNQVRAELGEKISTSQAFRLRRQANAAFKIGNGKVIQITEESKNQK